MIRLNFLFRSAASSLLSRIFPGRSANLVLLVMLRTITVTIYTDYPAQSAQPALKMVHIPSAIQDQPAIFPPPFDRYHLESGKIRLLTVLICGLNDVSMLPHILLILLVISFFQWTHWQRLRIVRFEKVRATTYFSAKDNNLFGRDIAVFKIRSSGYLLFWFMSGLSYRKNITMISILFKSYPIQKAWLKAVEKHVVLAKDRSVPFLRST